jgi:eukaryotic-like serine/threonine-protein kinase
MAGPFELQPGSKFAYATDFRVIRKLSEGGMGAVYEVEQESTHRLRALKVLHPDLLGLPGIEERFKIEATIGARIESEHIIEVIAAGIEPVPWLAMELLEGEDLASFAMRTGPLPRGAVREIFDQLCHALGDAHQKGIVHRDLKPENIFLARPRRRDVVVTVKILDFGIAKILAEMKTASSRTHTMVGTPLWMAPEQMDPEGDPITQATDVWALGLIAFRLLTGRVFWKTPSLGEAGLMRLLNEIGVLPIPAASARAAELGVGGLVPPGFDAWFAKCLSRDPASRHPDATSTFEGFDRLLEGNAKSVPAPPWSRPPPSSPHAAGLREATKAAIAAGATFDGPITFAAVSGSPHAEGYLAEICLALERGLHRPVLPRVLLSYSALTEEMEAGRVQIVWAPPRVAIELEEAELATIDLCCARGGQVDYHAALFTGHASRVATLDDLRGCHAAWVHEQSSAGYLLPRLKLAEEGWDPGELFGRESFLGTHARVACAVLDGEADVGATYVSLDPRTERPLSAGWLDAGAGINGALILATAGPIPSDAIVFSSHLPSALKATLVAHVKELPKSTPEAVGRLLGADGFAAPRATHFRALRTLLATHHR